MPKRKNRFQRIPLNQVPSSDSSGRHEQTSSSSSTVTSNVQKHAAHPKRSIKKEGDDHPLGLWIDREMLRKHQNRTPKIVLHNPLPSADNRYLALADLALGNDTKAKKRARPEMVEAGSLSKRYYAGRSGGKRS